MTALGLVGCAASLQARAQQSPAIPKPPAAPTESPLTRKVHLSPDITTTAAILQAVSEQTGLTIRVADYLKERKIVMQVKDISAADLLNTLAELNDWTWRGNAAGVIFVERRKKDTPRQMAEVPIALQYVLPADFRAFLGSTGRLNDPMYHEEPDAQGHFAGGAFRKGNAGGMQKAAQTLHDDLYRLLTPALKPGFAVAYTRLTDAQRHILLVATVLNNLSTLNSANSHNVLQGTLRPYELDLAAAELTLRGGSLMVGSTRHLPPAGTDWAGFGIDATDVLNAPAPLTPPTEKAS